MDLTLRSYERAFGFTFSPEDRLAINRLLDKRSTHVLKKLERLNRSHLKKREIVRIFQESEVECFDQPDFIWASDYFHLLGVNISESRLPGRRRMDRRRFRALRIPRRVADVAGGLIDRKAEAIELHVKAYNSVTPRIPLLPNPLDVIRGFLCFITRGTIPIRDYTAEEKDRIMETYRFEKEMFRHTRIHFADDVLDEYLALSRRYSRSMARRLVFLIRSDRFGPDAS